MLFRLLRLYWRETCNVRTLAFLLVMLLLTGVILVAMRGQLAQASEVPGVTQDASGADASSGGDPGATTEANTQADPALAGLGSFFKPVRVSIVDEDESFISYSIVENFSDLAVIDAVYVESLALARQRLANNEILMILQIPAGFYEQTMAGVERDSLKVYLNERMPAEAAILKRVMNNAADSLSAVQASMYAWAVEARPLFSDENEFIEVTNATVLTMAFRMLGRNNLVDINMAAKFNTIWYVISALTCLFSMLPALLVLTLVLQERAIGQHERLLLANVPWWQLHLAKALIGLMWLVAGLLPLAVLILHFLPQLQPLNLLLAVVLLYFIAALLGLALAYRSRQEQEVLLAAWLGIMGILLLGGCIYPTQLLSAWILPLTRLSPAYWSFQLIYTGLAAQPVTGWLVLGPLVTLAVATALSYLSWRWAT